MNRISRYYRIGHAAEADERRGYWHKTFAWKGLSAQGLADEQIAGQFGQCSKDTVRNGRRARELFDAFVTRGGPVAQRAWQLRRSVDKGLFEITARFYAKHGDLDKAFDDLNDHSEFSTREYDELMQIRYGGPHHAERVLFARLQGQLDDADQDVWALVETKVLPKRLAEEFRAAKVAMSEKVQTVRDALHGQEGT